LLQHFDGMEKNFEGTDFEHVSKWMLENGYSFDFFSDRQLQNFTVSGDKILSGGNNYKTILLPANKFIPPASLKMLIALADKGINILFYKQAPENAPGLAVKRSEWIEFFPVEAKYDFKQEGLLKKARIGKGSFIISDDLDVLLNKAKVRKEDFVNQALSVIRRKNKDGVMYFINNRTNTALNNWTVLNEKSAFIALFDAMTGLTGLAKSKKNPEGKTEVLLQLQPYESVIIQTYKVKKTANIFPYRNVKGKTQTITGQWTIEFLDGGPTLPAKIISDELYAWSDLDTSEYYDFSGTAKYSIQFNRPSAGSSAYLLDLGEVHETAEVIFNGKKIATLIGPTFQCVIPASAFQSSNKLEVIVANLMANRIAYMDRNNIPWKIFYNTNMPARKKENVKNGLFDASAWKPLPSGLLGPVTLTPMNNE
jgi:hypothetical protein